MKSNRFFIRFPPLPPPKKKTYQMNFELIIFTERIWFLGPKRSRKIKSRYRFFFLSYFYHVFFIIFFIIICFFLILSVYATSMCNSIHLKNLLLAFEGGF